MMTHRKHLGTVHDKPAALAARDHRAVTGLGVIITTFAATAALAVMLDWHELTARLAAVLSPLPV